MCGRSNGVVRLLGGTRFFLEIEFMLLILLLFFILNPTEVCEQWFLDTDNNPMTGYKIHDIGADVILDVHGDVRSVFGDDGPGGWGGLIPATIIMSTEGNIHGWVEIYDCDTGCEFCRFKRGLYEDFFYFCADLPAKYWKNADKNNLQHMSEWINCFGQQ